MKKLDYLAKYTFSTDSPYDTHWWTNNITDYHCHADYYELFIPLIDGLTHYYNGVSSDIDRQCVYLIPKNQYHRITQSVTADKPALFNLSVLPDFFDMYTELYSQQLTEHMTGKTQKECIVLPLSSAEYDYLIALSDKLMFLVDENKRRKIICLILSAVAMQYDLKYKNIRETSGAESYAADLQSRIDNLEYLETSIAEIYKKYPISHVVLIDAFKKLTGQTIVKYMVARKMSYACSLLQNTDFNILTIAQEVGYDVPSHFIDNFKDFTGLTPSRYRRQYTQKNKSD